ncbi:probable purine permease 11 [Impatiens glandulifera]|uniref:probable purine permease 11 n=1 Tax=Impatiens glandulifera TaxID=253017 RepID=UPI001FB0B11C|nr:probable purine permease 11 [Impatiens glandulifera]
MSADTRQLILMDDRNLILHSHISKLEYWKWWFLVALNITFLTIGQSSAIILGRVYYDHGGNSTWMATLVQTAAFPILIPCLFISSSRDSPISQMVLIYFALGLLLAVDNMLYSIGLLYLSASTYSLICAIQLAFNAVFSFLINGQKFTMLIFNSVIVLTLSAALLALNDGSGEERVSRLKYVIGFISTIGASALYSLLLSLLQLVFQKFLKEEETFSVVLYMQIYTCFVATSVSVMGLFGSGEWNLVKDEMNSFSLGKTSYVLNLVGTAVSWQVSSVGVVGLVFAVSSLFSNVISTLSLAITPIVAVVVLRDMMNGVKVISLLMALWGFATYIYQNYLDDCEERLNRDKAHPHIV